MCDSARGSPTENLRRCAMDVCVCPVRSCSRARPLKLVFYIQLKRSDLHFLQQSFLNVSNNKIYPHKKKKIETDGIFINPMSEARIWCLLYMQRLSIMYCMYMLEVCGGVVC